MDRGSKQAQTQRVFHSLRRHLALTADEIGCMFGSDGETAAAWASGDREVPEMTFARIVGAESALRCLLEIFLPERLPDVVRRAAPAFENRRALDWILEGRIAEVARRYEDGLHYSLPKSA